MKWKKIEKKTVSLNVVFKSLYLIPCQNIRLMVFHIQIVVTRVGISYAIYFHWWILPFPLIFRFCDREVRVSEKETGQISERFPWKVSQLMNNA